MQTVEDFFELHGDSIVVDNRRIFADGASCTLHPPVFLNEPPADDYDRLLRCKKFWEELLRRAKSDFKAINAAMRGGPHVHSSALYNRELPADGIEALRHLQIGRAHV